jgi:FlaA1/EpsC-like NDP-sugar epimerase
VAKQSMVMRFLPYRRPLIVFAHALLVVTSWFLAFVLIYELPLEEVQEASFWKGLPLLVIFRLLLFHRYSLFEGLWQYVSMRDLTAIIKAVSLSSLVFLATALIVYGYQFVAMRRVLVTDWVICSLLITAPRVGVRMIRESLATRRVRAEEDTKTRILVVGAGDAAATLIRDLQDNLLHDYEVVGLVDDDPRKRGRRLHGFQVIGNVADIPQLCQANDVDQILLAVPSASIEEREQIISKTREASLPLKSVPTLGQLLRGKRIGQLEDVSPQDLLGRQAVRIDGDKLSREVTGRRVLVTGAGGSVGSELCRQLSTLGPDVLLMYERAESSLYFIDLELENKCPGLKKDAVVGDILDAEKLDDMMRVSQPDVVYHAAAYKHVPLMERHPIAAVQNNVFGTETVALAARRAGVRKFVLISTDKAVQPVSTMGRTKRVAEDLVRTLDAESDTTYVSVRFGNVLGSAGSVLPLFQWQMARGGPVTITDPDATRYFMLIAEAAQLVLQAGAMGKGGEIFFLDMGSPMKIIDLADRLIKLSGFAPGKEMAMQTVGLRAGERMREELVMETEELVSSDHDQIYVTQNPGFNPARFRENLDALRHLVRTRNEQGTLEHLARMAADQ